MLTFHITKLTWRCMPSGHLGPTSFHERNQGQNNAVFYHEMPHQRSQCLRSKKLFIHCIYIAMQATELPIALLGKSTKGWCSLNCTKSAPSRSWEMIFYPMLFFGFCMVLDILVAFMRLSSKALIAGFFPSCGGSFQILKNGVPLHDFYPTTI